MMLRQPPVTKRSFFQMRTLLDKICCSRDEISLILGEAKVILPQDGLVFGEE
jgi:hypothetical protein